ncbi:ATP-binding protein [Kiloniella sp.]|uniref:ATP-binding protein n=1 Tax=Kiloniella sp. TaxID=1938587 RepID=UPI003B01722C
MRLTSRSPIILVFEDVHWADNATLDLFRFLGRRISFLNCLLIISFRDDEINDQHPLRPVLDVLPSAHTKRIIVEPLTEEGITQLAPCSKHDFAKLHEITAGNPFFVTELLETDDQIDKSLPASVRDAINARLIRLGQQERNFLETISLIPHAISQELVDNLCGPTGETFAMACVDRNFLVIDSHGDFRFRHELARLGTLARVSVNQQKILHSEIVTALEQCNDNNIGSLVHHAAGALDGSRVLRYAPMAAKNAADLGAHQEAASYLATALRFVDEAPTELAAQLYDDWAYETGLALQIDDEVIEARRHAITLWRALDRKDKVGENLRWLSRLHWYRGEAAEAGHFSNEAIKVLESGSSPLC